VDDREAAVLTERRRWGAVSQKAAEKLYKRGLDEYEAGRLSTALERFTLARRMATRREWQVEIDLDRYIANIRGDVAHVERQLEEARQLVKLGQWANARQILYKLLREFRKADLIRDMKVPLEILTVPPGATLEVGGVEIAQKTPAVVEISPFEATPVVVRKGLFVEKRYSLGPILGDSDPGQLSYTWKLPRAATWQKNIGDHIESAPVAWGGRVAFVGRNGRWYVFAAQTGKRIASEKLKTFGVSADLASDGELLFIPTLDGKLVAIDGASCKVRYVLEGFEGGIYAAPVIADGRIYITEDAGFVSAYNLKSRKRAWRTPVANGVRARPIVQGDDLVLVATTGTVIVLRRKDGKEIKRYELRGAFSRAPAVSGEEDLIFPAEEGVLLAIERVTGTQRWIRDLKANIPATPVVRGRVAFVAPQAGELTAIDTQTGDVTNRYSDSASVARTPVADKERMFFANGKTLCAFAAREGGYGLAWSFTAQGRILAGPVLAGDAVYIGDAKGNIYRLEAND
jgi:outer membrane protein assembly factor BamB